MATFGDLLILPNEGENHKNDNDNEFLWSDRIRSVLAEFPKEIARLIGQYATRWTAKWARYANVEWSNDPTHSIYRMIDTPRLNQSQTLSCWHHQTFMYVYSDATLRQLGSHFSMHIRHEKPSAICGHCSIDFGIWDPKCVPCLSIGGIWLEFDSEREQILTFEVLADRFIVRGRNGWKRSSPIQTLDCHLAIRFGAYVHHEFTFLDPFFQDRFE